MYEMRKKSQHPFVLHHQSTRVVQTDQNRLAPISELFASNISKCSERFVPSEHCSLDEQLISFKGCRPFKMYTPAKHDKYKIKCGILFSQTNSTYTRYKSLLHNR